MHDSTILNRKHSGRSGVYEEYARWPGLLGVLVLDPDELCPWRFRVLRTHNRPAADLSGASFPRNFARAEQLVSFVAQRIVFESDGSARCVC